MEENTCWLERINISGGRTQRGPQRGRSSLSAVEKALCPRVIVGWGAVHRRLTSELADPWVPLGDGSQLGLEALPLHTSAPSCSACLRSVFWETTKQLGHSKPSAPGTFCSESRQRKQQPKPHFKYLGLSRYVRQTTHLLALKKCSALGPLWGNMHETGISMS